MSTRKVGGIRFIRIGRLQISLCICKPKAAKARAFNSDAALFCDGITLALAAGILAHFIGG